MRWAPTPDAGRVVSGWVRPCGSSTQLFKLMVALNDGLSDLRTLARRVGGQAPRHPDGLLRRLQYLEWLKLVRTVWVDGVAVSELAPMDQIIRVAKAGRASDEAAQAIDRFIERCGGDCPGSTGWTTVKVTVPPSAIPSTGPLSRPG